MSAWLNLQRQYLAARRILRKRPPLQHLRRDLYTSLWQEAATEIGAEIEAAGDDYFRITRAGRYTLVQFHYVNIDTYFNLKLVGQKPIIHGILKAHGYPIPRYLEYDLGSLKRAVEFIEQIGGSFVVKPREGSGGTGITTGIRERRRLTQASVAAAAAHHSRSLMIEQQSPGDSFRLLFLDGALIDAVQRCRPSVIGDGHRGIQKLIEDENLQRRGAGPSRSLIQLNFDMECRYYLEDQGLGRDTVPQAGQLVTVKNVANENSQRDNFTVREQVHPDYLQLGRHLTEILGIKLFGIDVMAEDIGAALSRGAVINEINIPPGLHYHELIANSEERAHVGARILEFILSKRSIETSLPVSGSAAAD